MAVKLIRALAAMATLAQLGTALEAAEPAPLELPYQEVGLDERQAAAYALDRLTFGARPGDVERIVAVGLEHWIAQQLAGTQPEPVLDARLDGFEAIGMSHEELAARYPNSSQMSAHIRRFHPGLIPPRDVPILDFSVVSAKIDAFRALNGFLTQEKELHDQLVGQKMLRAVYAENQLREVLTDFWHNHFFTSPASFNARLWILPYEQEALRPNALGDFRTLLGAVSKHPAMRSYYVGNERAADYGPTDTTMARAAARKQAEGESAMAVDALVARARSEIIALEYEEDLVLSREFWPKTGPNPEYARALLSLHTLGPDGQWSEADLEGVARAFTGWTAMPVGPSPQWFERGLDEVFELGFISDGSFLFRADQHDARPKTIFGDTYPAGGGVDEGERVLDRLAAHEDTARHIAQKLAARFVAEEPPQALIRRLAEAFALNDGSIAAVMRALVESPEFWAAADARTKVKTPLEYVASALRATGADVTSTAETAGRMASMGQPLYMYLEPTGFPDAGAYWLDTASLIHRLNFAQDLAENRIAGVAISPGVITAASDVESRTPSDETVASRLLPGRELDTTLDRLKGALGEPTSLAPVAAEQRFRSLTAFVIASPEFQLR